MWLAAVLSREDGELACDEGTLRALGADERAAYGKTLLALVPVCDKPQNPLLGATTMTSGKRSLKERITRIAENRQAKAAAVFAVVALAALVCAVSFTGAPDTPPEVTQEWYDAGFTTEDAQACLEFLDWAAGFDGDNATGASWMADGEASLNALEPQAEFARVVRSIRMEELSPFTDSDEKTLYTLGFNDGRASYGFGMHEGGRITLIAPREVESGNKMYPYKASVAVVDNAALSALFDYLRGEASPEQISHPAFPNNLTEAERSVVDEFLHWAQALRAEDILNLRFQSGSGSRFLVDAELTALSAQLVPALNALTEAELYTQRGYGDSTYYTLTVNLRDGTQYTFLCGFDCVRLLSPAFEPALSSSYPSDRPTLWIDSPALMACIDSLEASPAPLPDFETAAPTPLADILPAREPWLTIPLAGKAQRIADRRIPSDALDWLTQMDMDGDGVCEIVNSSDFPAIYYKRGGRALRRRPQERHHRRVAGDELLGLHILPPAARSSSAACLRATLPAMGSTSRAISTSTVKACCSTSPIAATPTTSLTRRLPIRAFPPKSPRGQSSSSSGGTTPLRAAPRSTTTGTQTSPSSVRRPATRV